MTIRVHGIFILPSFLKYETTAVCRGAYGAAMASFKGQEEVLLRSGKCKLGFTHYTTDKPCRDGQFVREGCHQGEIWGQSVAGAGDGRCQRLSSCRGLFYLTKKVNSRIVFLDPKCYSDFRQ